MSQSSTSRRFLEDEDDSIRPPGPESNWNESRYVDFFDPRTSLAGWFRLGNRPNEGHAEMTACMHLPDGRVAFAYSRPKINGNGDEAAGLRWGVVRPFEEATLHFNGEMSLLADPLSLLNPKQALGQSPKVMCQIALTNDGDGLPSVLGADQSQFEKIFLPGQAAGHYQHLVRTRGSVRVGDQQWSVAGLGGRDHSWGPRNWHSKRYFRWLCGSSTDGFGFMLTRAVSDHEQRRGGFLWLPEDGAGRFRWIDHFDLRSEYRTPGHLLQRCVVTAHESAQASARRWTFEGTPVTHLPLRHRRVEPGGGESVLRIVKAPTRWRLDDGREAFGITEYHDQMAGDEPVDLSE